MNATVSTISRWINGVFRREEPPSDNNDEVLQQCYVCNQFGVPNFHSTRCDPKHQPAWEALAGSSLVPIEARSAAEPPPTNQKPGLIPRVLDPRSDGVLWWSRVVLLARVAALAVDPFFFFSLVIGSGGGGGRPCVYVDGGVATAASVARSCLDVMHLCHVWIQFRLAYVSRESLVVGCGRLVWDSRVIAVHYLRSLKGFWLDTFVLLPIPQVLYWLILPWLLREGRIELANTLIPIVFLLHFIPKVYHCYRLMHRTRVVTGYVFGSIWWRFGLSFIIYFLASHASGGYWYSLAIHRIFSCLTKECNASKRCGTMTIVSLSCSSNTSLENTSCLDKDGPFPYGLYKLALPLISCNSIITRILYSNLWGLMAFSTMGNNLEPTSQCGEVIFACCIVVGGLLLFTMLIGNIQVFLSALTMRTRKMQVRSQDMEWWMKRRQLSSSLRERVRHFENQRWSVMGGQDEMGMVKDLPEGLRRDIKRYLCLDLIKKAPLFKYLDDVILDNICDRVSHLIYSKGEKVIREGDPVQKMVFIVHGRVKRSQGLTRGTVATSTLEPGSFLGDELLSWSLRVPFIDRYPASTATFTCVKATEAFGLDAKHLRYITDHFRYAFGNEKIKRTARYYSSNWRTWAAVNIQLGWRRYATRTRKGSMSYVTRNDRRLQHYAAMFMSLRPHDHLE